MIHLATTSRRNGAFILKSITAFLAISVLLDIFLSTTIYPHNAIKHQNLQNAKIGKVSMLYGASNPLYERALNTHQAHNDNFGYPFFVLREQTLPAYWSKPAYLLRLLLAELEKPEAERLEWLVWVDGDTVIMNPNIPLEIFLPPPDKWNHIHTIVTNDHRGLNNGVFFLRVHEWSVWLMNNCLGTQTSVPNLDLEFGDQSALQYWLNVPEFRNNTIHVPQRWFNAYAGSRGASTDLFADPMKPSSKYKANSVVEGDLLVHHAGHKALRAQRMLPWIEVAEQHLAAWELGIEQTKYKEEITEFWEKEAKNERKTVDKMQKTLEEAARKKQAAAEKSKDKIVRRARRSI